MRDCSNPEVCDLLPDHLSGTSSEAAHRKIVDHLQVCAKCRAELALLTELRTLLRRPLETIDPLAIGASIPLYRAPRSRSTSGWRIAAMIAFIVGGMSIAVFRPGWEPATTVSTGPALAARPILPSKSVDARSVDRRVGTVGPVPIVVSRRQSITSGELAMGSAVIGDLDERDLSHLLSQIGTLDAVPSIDEVDDATPVLPLAPGRGEG